MKVDRRVEQGGDWWLADDLDVPAEANVLDFVFSDGGGKFDNNKDKDYHTPVDIGASTEAMVAERADVIQSLHGLTDEATAVRAGRRAERAVLAHAAAAEKAAASAAFAKIVTLPSGPTAGTDVEVYYRHQHGRGLRSSTAQLNLSRF
jgi:hypothetical protein